MVVVMVMAHEACAYLKQKCWRRSGRQTLKTIGDLAQEQLLLCVRPDGLRRSLGRSAMAQRVFFFAADLDLVSWKGPRREGEIVGCVLASAGHLRCL
jgi:hypothetical protein